MEEGEIPSSTAQQAPEYSYDPSVEWPGADDVEEVSFPSPRAARILRFVVDKPTSATGFGTVALVDGHDEIQIGRDALPTGTRIPRIRIKTVEVSKHHATVFWNGAHKEWAIVDMGSMHGTFVRPYSSDARQRLSSARAASMPRRLSHLDSIFFGSTGFTVHIHDDVACEKCSPRDLSDELPLFPSSTRAPKRVPVETEDFRSHPYTRDPKKALSSLRRNLLSQHLPLPSKDVQPAYVDRSARRREMYPSSALDAPGTQIQVQLTRSALPIPSVVEPVSQPSVPLAPTNIGHKLLAKQGWQPGTSLGLSSDGIAVPLDGEAMTLGGRRGLGMGKR